MAFVSLNRARREGKRLQTDFGGGDDIIFEKRGLAGIITLSRAKALNALSHQMIVALSRALTAWEHDPEVHHVIVRADGRAFCAGGDIIGLYHAGKSGTPDYGLFFDEYRMNAQVARYPKPYIALIDGIVMGGGVGISVHGSHRVMSEKAVFAMPEVGIGFFPDVGGSYFLPRIVGHYGIYLGLTGERIRWGNALHAGIGTHGVASERFEELCEALVCRSDITTVFSEFEQHPATEIDARTFETIDTHFAGEDVKSIIASLTNAARTGEAVAAAMLETIRKRSPTSVHVAFRQMVEGAGLTMDQCMRMEFRIVNRMLQGHDFYEGIRAAVVDRTSPPQWCPAELEQVTPGMIESYFAPLDNGELPLP